MKNKNELKFKMIIIILITIFLISLLAPYIAPNDPYTVDLSRKFNSAYIKTDEESVNKNPTKATDLKLTNPTLIKIKDKKVIDYIEGYDQIKNYMS